MKLNVQKIKNPIKFKTKEDLEALTGLFNSSITLVRHHPASIDTINTKPKQNQRFVPLRRLRDNDDAVKNALKEAKTKYPTKQANLINNLFLSILKKIMPTLHRIFGNTPFTLS